MVITITKNLPQESYYITDYQPSLKNSKQVPTLHYSVCAYSRLHHRQLRLSPRTAITQIAIMSTRKKKLLGKGINLTIYFIITLFYSLISNNNTEQSV